MYPRPSRRRPGMTLIELLVVIAIIALLAALLVGAVVRVQDKGQEFRVRTDLEMLNTAVANFRSGYSNTPLPSGGGGTNGTFRLCSDYPSPATDSWPEKAVMLRLFPRMSTTDNGLRQVNHTTDPPTINTTTTVSSNAPILLDPNQCMVFFLTGGSFTDYTGFSTDPAQPFKSTGSRKNAFFELPKAKRINPGTPTGRPAGWFESKKSEFTWLAANTNNVRWNGASNDDGNQEPWMIDPWGNPYLYLSSNVGNDYPFANTTGNTQSGVQIGPWGGLYSPFEDGAQAGAGRLYADAPSGTKGPFPFRESNTKFTNRQTFQIISAGPDGLIGPGSPLMSAGPPATFVAFKPGGTNYTAVDAGGDDYTNFHPRKLAND